MALFPHPIKCEKGKICFRTSHRLVVLEYRSAARAVTEFPSKSPSVEDVRTSLGSVTDPFPQGNNTHPFSKELLARQLWSGSHILEQEQEQELAHGVDRAVGSPACSCPCSVCAGLCALKVLPHIPGRFVAPSQHRFLSWEGQLDHPISAMEGL